MSRLHNKITAKERQHIGKLVDHFVQNRHLFAVMLDQIKAAFHGSTKIMELAHSTKWRVKDSEHLKDKLLRKMLEAKETGKQFPYTEQNLFSKINDLAGFRILHLHTQQI